MTSPLDSLPTWVQPKVKAMLEDLRERAAKWHDEQEIVNRQAAKYNAEKGLTDSANMRNIVANEHRYAAAAIRALSLTPESAPEKEEPSNEESAIRAAGVEAPPMCECGHWGYEHGMLDACAVFGCDCGRFMKEPARLPPVAGEEKPPVKKPMDHPDYEFAPGMFNLSKWSRENEPKGPPRFKVGDRVLFTHPLYIHKVYEDCDGTPLFAAGMEDPATLNAEEKQCPNDWILIRSFSADSFAPAPSPPNAEQGEDEGVVKLTDDAEWAGECRKCDCLLCIHVVEERAALLACRERARELYVAICAAWPTNGITEALAKYAMAEAQADKVVP